MLNEDIHLEKVTQSYIKIEIIIIFLDHLLFLITFCYLTSFSFQSLIMHQLFIVKIKNV